MESRWHGALELRLEPSTQIEALKLDFAIFHVLGAVLLLLWLVPYKFTLTTNNNS
jgi:hypothetical protein